MTYHFVMPLCNKRKRLISFEDGALSMLQSKQKGQRYRQMIRSNTMRRKKQYYDRGIIAMIKMARASSDHSIRYFSGEKSAEPISKAAMKPFFQIITINITDC